VAANRRIPRIARGRGPLAAAAVRIPVEAETAERSVASLPPRHFFLRADSWPADFRGAEDLLGKLFELAQNGDNDFEAFQAWPNGVAAPFFSAVLLLGVLAMTKGYSGPPLAHQSSTGGQRPSHRREEKRYSLLHRGFRPPVPGPPLAASSWVGSEEITMKFEKQDPHRPHWK